MDETLRQIGELLLQSVPTVIFVVSLYGLYSFLVHRPLVKVLAERRSMVGNYDVAVLNAVHTMDGVSIAHSHAERIGDE